MSAPAALILAAGAGTRMGGVCKATLQLPGGETFVAAIARTAREAGCGRVIVVAAAPYLDAVAGAVPQAFLVENPAPERGMHSSFAVAVGALAAARSVLVWPVDLPQVTSRTVRLVVDSLAPDRIVVPCHEGRGGHPTGIGASLLAQALRGPTLRDVVLADEDRVIRIPVEDPGVVRDVDTPSDYGRLIS
jgi:molybdenum cofactor cytidylyltransferase